MQSKKNGKKVYALKILGKNQLVQHKQVQNVINEKKILQMAKHPFILNMYNTFQDRDCLYFLLEFIRGGEVKKQIIYYVGIYFWAYYIL